MTSFAAALLSALRCAVAGSIAALLCLTASAAPEADGTTPLHWAVYRQEVALVASLLAQQADPDSRNDYGATPMTVAAEHGNHAIMQALVEAGGNIESPNSEGQTLLMAVARTGNTATARLLLEQGANVNARENWGGQTALMWAASQQQPDMIRLLIAHGADVDARSKEHDWPRWVTSEPRIKPLDPGGYTPLLYAAREGCQDCVAALLDGGANINLKMAGPTLQAMCLLLNQLREHAFLFITQPHRRNSKI